MTAVVAVDLLLLYAVVCSRDETEFVTALETPS